MTQINYLCENREKQKPSEREVLHGKLARRAAAEGIVLLKNDKILPLSLESKVALFGNGASCTVKGGIGSGDVNNRKSISIYEGMLDIGGIITSETWLKDYEKSYKEARLAWKERVLEAAKNEDNPFDAYAANPFSLPDGRRVNAADIEGAEAAIYVISRISGEGKDRRKIEGDYYLSKREWDDILYLNEQKIPIILIINSGGPVELTDLLEKAQNIRGILNISQLGQEGGHAVADILYGKKMPEGRLTTTWAKRYEDYPSADTFGYLNGNLDTEEYRENIYVGYRYFDTFEIQPLFPFGYGLSYTTFNTEFVMLEEQERKIQILVSVENTGEDYAGREVVQVYVTPPQSGIEKEYKRLVGFAKTKLLNSREKEVLSIEIEQKQLASFSETENAWIVENGTYGIWIGEDASSLQLAAAVQIPEKTVIERTRKICPLKTDFEEVKANASMKKKEKEWLGLVKEKGVPQILFHPKEEVKKDALQYCAQEQNVEELIPLLYGNITYETSMLGCSGIRVPGSAGETTGALEERYGIPSLVMADGPAGIRLQQMYELDRETKKLYDVGVLGSLENGFLATREPHDNVEVHYQYCTAFPVGTALAQTWDIQLMKEFGEAIAEEMKEYHVHLWLAPGMNIHRNPLCGRNFEYYSEDPLLSGVLAAAVTSGVQSRSNCGVTIKHFACNNQEDNRMGVDSCLAERALREIYLRGFEIAVKQGNPAAVMSSYNLVNGVHAANSFDLCTQILREEWGFDGIVMSDWNTTIFEDGSIPWKCIEAGNDMIMPGSRKDDEDIRNAYQNGKISEEQIRSSAGRILAMIDRLTVNNMN